MVFPFTPNNETGQTLVGGIALFGGVPHVGASGSAPLVTAHVTAVAPSQAATSLRYDAVILADYDSQKIPEIKVTGAEVSVEPTGTGAGLLPAPTPFVVTQTVSASRQNRASDTPFTPILAWILQHLDAIKIAGVGLVVASLVYVLIVRLAPVAPAPAPSPSPPRAEQTTTPTPGRDA
jgi:hypothetical protein